MASGRCRHAVVAVVVGVAPLVGLGWTDAPPSGDPPDGPGPRITVTRLLAPDGSALDRGQNVNERGEVVATVFDARQGGQWDQYLWRAGTATPIEPDGPGYLQAADLSERGQVVGTFWSGVPGAPITPHAASWRAGRWTQLDDGEGQASADKVNDRGQVLGRVSPTGASYQPVVWDAQGRMTVAPITGSAGPVDLNNRGQALLNVWPPESAWSQAAVWQVGGGVTWLGTLGGTSSEAWDINDAGEVTGVSTTADNRYHAFVWRRGRMIDLGTLGGEFSMGEAINEAGEIAGSASVANGVSHAAVWDERGRLTDLGTAGGNDAGASALNDRGQVIGHSTASSGVRQAVLFERGRAVPLDGLVSADASGGWALDINDRGQIVGGVTEPGEPLAEEVAIMWTVRPRP